MPVRLISRVARARGPHPCAHQRVALHTVIEKQRKNTVNRKIPRKSFRKEIQQKIKLKV
jgi:hypothetical protein